MSECDASHFHRLSRKKMMIQPLDSGMFPKIFRPISIISIISSQTSKIGHSPSKKSCLTMNGPAQRTQCTATRSTSRIFHVGRRHDFKNGLAPHPQWLRFTDSIYGFDLWIRCTDSIYGFDLRIRFIDLIYGFDLKIRFTASIYGFDLRIRFMDSIYGFDL